MLPENPAKAPWYYLGIQELVSYSAFTGGIGALTGTFTGGPYRGSIISAMSKKLVKQTDTMSKYRIFYLMKFQPPNN
jgi:hypothetical protein